MQTLATLLESTLLNNFRAFLKHALEHALGRNVSSLDAVQVVINTQLSLELLAKLFQMRTSGLKSILKESHHDEAEEQLIVKLERGNLSTIQFWRTREYFEREFEWSGYDKELISRFHDRRNAVAHLGLPSLDRKSAFDSILLLLRVINRIYWHENMPIGNKYMSNRLKELLGEGLFDHLFKNATFIDEAVEVAYEHCHSVYYCLECGNESWGNTEFDELLCFTCGYKAPEDAVGFMACPICDRKRALVYDAIQNPGTRVSGKCAACGYVTAVFVCPSCGLPREILRPDSECAYCGSHVIGKD